MKKLEAEKIEMSQIFAEDGHVTPVTFLHLLGNRELWEGISVGAPVTIRGRAIGKGFAGVVKRYHFKGGPATHGQSDRQRHPGSIGGTTTPGRVYKGKRMAGRLGGQSVTVKGLKVVSLEKEKGLIGVSGPVPGARRGQLVLFFGEK